MKRKKKSVTVKFWGARGSIATPGRSTLVYGGNTSCVEITSGEDFLILDGGTGIRLLGEDKIRRKKKPISILVSHTHMDHIAGIPFFAPARQNGQSIRIYGPPGLKKALKNLFPFPALHSRKLLFEIRPGLRRIPPFEVSTLWANHPGTSLAYRIRTPSGQTIVYISDHEPWERYQHGRHSSSEEKLLEWLQQPDLLIMDSQYFEKEYKKRRGWGHSPLSYTVALALKGGAKKLSLFHHDPAHSDKLLERKLREVRRLVSRSGKRLSCSLAREGQTITLAK